MGCYNGRMAKLTVNIDVDDLPRAERFYTRAVGLSIGRRFGPFATELLGGETPIYLLVKKPGSAPFPGAETSRSFQRHWTPVHIDFIVEDIDQAVARAVEAGARQEGETQTHQWGRMALMADPFGHGFCFLQFLGRGYDEVITGSGGSASPV